MGDGMKGEAMVSKAGLRFGFVAALLAFFHPAAAVAQDGPPIRLLQPVAIKSADYPLSALRNGIEGKVRILLTIEQDGTVGGCGILESADDQALDDKACEIYRSRARFNAATDNALRQVEVVVVWSLSDTSGTALVPTSPPKPTATPFAFLDGFAAAYPQVLLHGKARVDDPALCFEFASGLNACPFRQLDGVSLLNPVDIVELSQIVDTTTGNVEGLFAEYKMPERMVTVALTAKLGEPCFSSFDEETGMASSLWRNGEDFVIQAFPAIIVMSRATVGSDASLAVQKACF